ncbi:MAG: hypothetical protein ABSE73_29510, partial [Planctomycetota bacterium]
RKRQGRIRYIGALYHDFRAARQKGSGTLALPGAGGTPAVQGACQQMYRGRPARPWQAGRARGRRRAGRPRYALGHAFTDMHPAVQLPGKFNGSLARPAYNPSSKNVSSRPYCGKGFNSP